jgi:hypothetical protein
MKYYVYQIGLEKPIYYTTKPPGISHNKMIDILHKYAASKGIGILKIIWE